MKLSFLIFCIFSSSLFARLSPTVAEKTSFVSTGDISEVVALCQQYQKQFPQKAKCHDLGKTDEGLNLRVLIVSSQGLLTPKLAMKKNTVVFFIQAGIHPGEIDGKDAGFIFLRNVLEDKSLQKQTKDIVFVFLPVFNLDGFSRFSSDQRPNQNGPKESGWRVTGKNLNLNRDHLKLDDRHSQLIINFINQWRPHLLADLHVTNGADFQHEIAFVVAPFGFGHGPLLSLAKTMEKKLVDDLTAQNFSPLWFYPSFIEASNPLSGVERSVSTPRFSEGLESLKNSLAVLVETHSWKPYDVRVKATLFSLSSLVSFLNMNLRQILEARSFADKQSQNGLIEWKNSYPLSFKLNQQSKTVEMKGFHFDRRLSIIDGSPVTLFDRTKKENWPIQLFDQVIPDITIDLPQEGYYVSNVISDIVIPRLKAHHISYQILKKEIKVLGAQSFFVKDHKFSDRSYEGHQMVTVQGHWIPSEKKFPAGTVFVPIKQIHAQVLIHLLEPLGPDSLVRWGYLNAYFEQKEGIEDYVLEEFAQEFLKDEKNKQEFEAMKNNKDLKNEDLRKYMQMKHPSGHYLLMKHYRQLPIYRY